VWSTSQHSWPWQPDPKLTPIQVLERLHRRLEKRMEALQRIKLAGFDMVIAELEVERDLLRRAARDLEEKSSGPQCDS
jgi:cob(I)alamin adenosyltransferase